MAVVKGEAADAVVELGGVGGGGGNYGWGTRGAGGGDANVVC